MYVFVLVSLKSSRVFGLRLCQAGLDNVRRNDPSTAYYQPNSKPFYLNTTTGDKKTGVRVLVSRVR